MTYLYFVFLFSIEMLTVLVRFLALSKFTGFPHKSYILSSSSCVRHNFSSVGKF